MIGRDNLLGGSHPNPFGGNHREFVEFITAQKAGGKAMVQYLLTHPSLAYGLLRDIGLPSKSLFSETFWSGHPYLLNPGSDSPTAFKFAFQPTEENRTGLPETDPALTGKELMEASVISNGQRSWTIRGLANAVRIINERLKGKIGDDYLKDDLFSKLSENGVQTELVVQLEDKNRRSRSPIDKDLVPWTTDFEKVGTLTFLPQPKTGELISLGEDLMFNPGQFQHPPVGNMGFGRKNVSYVESAENRGAIMIADEQPALRQAVRLFGEQHPAVCEAIFGRVVK